MSEQVIIPPSDQADFSRAIPLEQGQDEPDLSKTVKYMERLHANEVLGTPEQSKKFLNSLSYDEFKKWVSFVNGVELGIPSSERGQVSSSVVTAESGLMGTEVEYTPPHKNLRERLMIMAFEKAQSVEDPEIAGLTLGLSINAIHYFADGNGRTARIAYALLTRGYDGSQEDQRYYSSLLENIKGRDVVNLNPAASGIDKKIRSEMFAKVQTQTGYKEIFGTESPTFVLDGYPDSMAGEFSPEELAVSDEIDKSARNALHKTMQSNVTMISLMATFSPERVKDFVRTFKSRGICIDGNAFLPTLTKEEIQAWYNNTELAIAGYVKRMINVGERDDVAEIAAHYRQTDAPH